MDSSGTVFSWHPEYKGQQVRAVRSVLKEEIARDQRAYQLALDAAEQAEFSAQATVSDLALKWGKFDFDWADQDAEELADRIVTFELERDQRQELISWSQYRDEQFDSGEEVTPELAWKTRPVLVIGLLGLLAILLVLWLAL